MDTSTIPLPDWMPTVDEMRTRLYIRIPRVVDRHHLVGLTVEGDCLAPAIRDGDIVIVDLSEKPADGRYAWIVQPAEPRGHIHWLKRLERRRGRWHFMMADGEGLKRRPGMSIRGIVVACLERATNTVHIEPWADSRQTRPAGLPS